MGQLYNRLHARGLRRQLRRRETNSEHILWSQLRRKQIDGMKFFRQFGVGRYILDFYAPSIRLAIEVDGLYHLKAAQREHDARRTEYLNECNIEVIRFWNDDVLKNLESVVAEITRVVALRKRLWWYQARNAP